MTDCRKGTVIFYILYNVCNSLFFLHHALVQPFLGCLSFPSLSDPSKKTKHYWGVTSWPSLGWIPTENAPGEFLEQHLPPTCGLLLASGILPLFPAAAGKFLVKLGLVWTLQADLISRPRVWKFSLSYRALPEPPASGNLWWEQSCGLNIWADPSSKAPQGPGLVPSLNSWLFAMYLFKIAALEL